MPTLRLWAKSTIIVSYINISGFQAINSVSHLLISAVVAEEQSQTIYKLVGLVVFQ